MKNSLTLVLIMCLALRSLAAGEKESPSAAPAWPVFRGNANLSGIAQGPLPANPERLWVFKTGDAVRSSPVVADGRVFIGSDDDNVYALSLKDGSRQWAYNAGGCVEAPPLFLDGKVFVGTEDGVFVALAADDGKLIWRFEAEAKVVGSANWTEGLEDRRTGGQQDQRSDGSKQILFGSHDNMMRCVDASSGNVVWQYEAASYINGAPAVSATALVFGGCDAQLHVLNPTDGSSLAKVDVGAYIAGSAALVDGIAYLGHYDNQLIAADLATKKVLWRYGDSEDGAPFFSSPAVTSDKVLAGSRDGRLHCVARDTGKPLWTFRTRGDVDSSPVVVGDRVIVGSSDGRLYIVSLNDGKKLWSYEIGEAVTGSPAVVDGKIIIGAEDGRVYAFGTR